MKNASLILSTLLVLMGATTASYVFQSASDVPGVNNVWATPGIIEIAAAETSDVDQICNDVSLNSSTALALDPTRSQFLDQPDVPRCLLVTPSDVVTTAIKFTGTDISGATITEWANFSASSTPVTTAKAFATVTMINATTSGPTRTVKIGTSDKLGLNQAFATNPVVYCALDGIREATAPTVTVSSTVLSENTIDTSGAPAGKTTKIWVLY